MKTDGLKFKLTVMKDKFHCANCGEEKDIDRIRLNGTLFIMVCNKCDNVEFINIIDFKDDDEPEISDAKSLLAMDVFKRVLKNRDISMIPKFDWEKVYCPKCGDSRKATSGLYESPFGIEIGEFTEINEKLAVPCRCRKCGTSFYIEYEVNKN